MKMMSSLADASGCWFQVNGLLYSSCSVHILLGIRVNKDVIRHIVRRIFDMEYLKVENRQLKDVIRKDKLIYRSKAMQDIMRTVKKVAPVNTPILITGKSGSGKELIAEAIHNLGNSAGTENRKPLIKINCPAIPATLLESELFGYQKGAFTGATTDFKGKVRLADGGTLFLDEIGDLPLNIQPKLLRLLEQKCFEPLGSTTTVTINTRIICSTNQDLESMVEKGLFREDLFYRINAITINIPPLRNRREDILPLSEFFLSKYSEEMGKKITGFSEGVKRALMSYDWPGNVRELRNVIERAVVLSGGQGITLSDIPLLESQEECPEEQVGESKLKDLEKKLLTDALRKCNGNITAAAGEVGISRNTLRYRMKKYNLTRTS